MRDYLPFPVLILAAMLPLSASAAIYKYIDENGRVAYGDKPVEGAKTIKVRSAPPSADKDSNTDENGVTDDNFGEDGEVSKYNSLKILNPTPEKIINDRSGSIQVIFLPTPRLSKNHQLIINVDGKDISRGRHGSLNLTNVTRGSHTVSGRIVNADGAQIIESAVVTFHVQDTGGTSYQ